MMAVLLIRRRGFLSCRSRGYSSGQCSVLRLVSSATTLCGRHDVTGRLTSNDGRDGCCPWSIWSSSDLLRGGSMECRCAKIKSNLSPIEFLIPYSHNPSLTVPRVVTTYLLQSHVDFRKILIVSYWWTRRGQSMRWRSSVEGKKIQLLSSREEIDTKANKNSCFHCFAEDIHHCITNRSISQS